MVSNVRNSTVVGRGEGGGVFTWFVVLFSSFFSILHIQKGVKSNNRYKVKYHKRILCNNVQNTLFFTKKV